MKMARICIEVPLRDFGAVEDLLKELELKIDVDLIDVKDTELEQEKRKYHGRKTVKKEYVELIQKLKKEYPGLTNRQILTKSGTGLGLSTVTNIIQGRYDHLLAK